MVRLYHKLGQVENKCTSHKPILPAIRVPKIIKVGGNLTTFWRKLFCTVLWDTVYVGDIQAEDGVDYSKIEPSADHFAPPRGLWRVDLI